MELGIEVLRFARGDACKMVPSRSLAAGMFVKQFVSGVQHEGSETPVQLLRTSVVLTGPLFDIHKALGYVSHDPTKSRRPMSFLLNMRAKSSQHEYENRAIFFMHRRKVICEALFFQAIYELHSLSPASEIRDLYSYVPPCDELLPHPL